MRVSTFLFASLALLLACHDAGQPVRKPEHSGVETEIRSVGSRVDSGAVSDLYGDWSVVGSSCPGICAMSSEDADSWIGITASLSENGVVFGEYNCRDATYESHRISRFDFYRDFRFDLEELSVLTEEVQVWVVSCEDQEWIAPGSCFLVRDEETLITPWDGVYFELKRARPKAD